MKQLHKVAIKKTMKRSITATVFASLIGILFASIAYAGSGHSRDHEAKQKAKAKCTEEHAALGHCKMEKPSHGADQHGNEKKMEKKKNTCTEEHAALGHCKMDKTSFHEHDTELKQMTSIES